jgi:hypothetical protein
MGGQVLINAPGQRLADESAVSLELSRVWYAFDVPGARGDTLAAEADPVARLCLARAKWEFREGFRLFADATDSGQRIPDAELLRSSNNQRSWRSALQRSQRRPEPMTIRAAHLAFGNLLLDRGPGGSARDHRCQISLLVANVVELKYDDVGLATVDAGMSPKVVDGPRAIIDTPGRRVPK